MVMNPANMVLPTSPWVIKRNSTMKIGVVFDGFEKSSNKISLNETLLVRPIVQDDLLYILLSHHQLLN